MSTSLQHLITLTRSGDPDATRALAVEARRRNDVLLLLQPLLEAPLPEDDAALLAEGGTPTAWRALTRVLQGHALSSTDQRALQTAIAGWPAEICTPTHDDLQTFIDSDRAPASFHFVRRLSLSRLPRRLQAQEGITSMRALRDRVAHVLDALLRACPHTERIDDIHAGPRTEDGEQPWLRALLRAAPPALRHLTLFGVAEDHLEPLTAWLPHHPLTKLRFTLTYDGRLPLEGLSRTLLQTPSETLTHLSTELLFHTTAHHPDLTHLARNLRRTGLIATLEQLDTTGPTPDALWNEARPPILFELMQRLAFPQLRSLVLPVEPALIQRMTRLAESLEHLESLELVALHTAVPEFLLDELREALPNTTVSYRESRWVALGGQLF